MTLASIVTEEVTGPTSARSADEVDAVGLTAARTLPATEDTEAEDDHPPALGAEAIVVDADPLATTGDLLAEIPALLEETLALLAERRDLRRETPARREGTPGLLLGTQERRQDATLEVLREPRPRTSTGLPETALLGATTESRADLLSAALLAAQHEAHPRTRHRRKMAKKKPTHNHKGIKF